MEPLAIREPDQKKREARLAARLRPTFHHTGLKWIKATHTPTGEIVAFAGWNAPGNPVHNPLRFDAIDVYPWRTTTTTTAAETGDDGNDGSHGGLPLTDEAWRELWTGCNIEAWDAQLSRDDRIRAEVMGDEPHWFLTPLATWPAYQGKGVGGRLLKWAIDQADATDPVTPMYLESAVTARAVYMHNGFVPQGGINLNMVRRGPRVLKEEDFEIDDSWVWEKKKEEPKPEAEVLNVDVVAGELEGELQH